jgi:hypothetical protein
MEFKDRRAGEPQVACQPEATYRSCLRSTLGDSQQKEVEAKTLEIQGIA